MNDVVSKPFPPESVPLHALTFIKANTSATMDKNQAQETTGRRQS
jgi:hypothetical protein